MSRLRAFTMLAASLWAVGACGADDPPPRPSAEVGVFFGGQMQHLKRIEITAVRPPKVGFRVHFPPPEKGGVAWSGEVHYEIVRPGPSGRRVTKTGKLNVPPGEERLDHVIAIESPHKLGVWNVRVLYDDQILADRALYLVEPVPSSL